MVKKALLHHEDIDFTVPIDYVGEHIRWPLITDRLKKAFHNPELIFGKPKILLKKSLGQKQLKERGRRKGPRL